MRQKGYKEIIILAGVLFAGLALLFIFKSRQTTKIPSQVKTDASNSSITPDPTLKWKQFTGENYLIKYPPEYFLFESHPELIDPKLKPRKGLIEIVSPTIPMIKTNYSIAIDWNINKYGTLDNIIKYIKDCELFKTNEKSSYILDGVEGVMYKDTLCSSHNSKSTYIYLIKNSNYFRIIVSSEVSYSMLQPTIDQIFFTFKFTD